MIKGGKSRIIFENEEFLCFEVFRKHLEVENDFIVTIAGVKYKNSEIIEMESLNENLDFDPGILAFAYPARCPWASCIFPHGASGKMQNHRFQIRRLGGEGYQFCTFRIW